MVAVRLRCTSKSATSVSVKAGLVCVADLSVSCSTQNLLGTKADKVASAEAHQICGNNGPENGASCGKYRWGGPWHS